MPVDHFDDGRAFVHEPCFERSVHGQHRCFPFCRKCHDVIVRMCEAFWRRNHGRSAAYEVEQQTPFFLVKPFQFTFDAGGQQPTWLPEQRAEFKVNVETSPGDGDPAAGIDDEVQASTSDDGRVANEAPA